MIPVRAKYLIVPLAAFLFLAPFPAHASAEVKSTFLYSLANFTGIVPFNYVREFVDAEKNEIYVVTGDSISIFNGSGMEVYRFGDDLNIGVLMDLSVESDGHILILSRVGSNFRLTRCNYRGEPQAGIEIRSLPKKFTGISPTRLLSRNGKLYLADLIAKKVVVTDANGVFQEGYDIAPLLTEFEEKPGPNTISSASPWTGRGTCSLPSPRCSGPSASLRTGNSPGSDPPGTFPGGSTSCRGS